MHYTKLTLALWATSGFLSVYAAEPTHLSPITVSGSPIHEHTAFEVPSQIDSVSGAQKMALDSGSLGQMLDHIPGVNHLSTGAQSGKPVIRGLTGNRIKILSNGQSTDFQGYDTRHNPNTEPFLAERIEVIRGPQSVLYGSEAVGGVVNVIQAPIPYGQGVHGEIASEYNTNNQETLFGVKMGAGSEQFGIQAGVVKRQADNFSVPSVRQALGVTPNDAPSDTPLLTGEVPNTNFENQGANIGLGWQGDWGLMEVRHTQWNAKQNFVGAEEGAADEPYEVVATGQKLHNDETQLKAELELGGDWVLKPSWTHTRNQREESHDLGYETMSEDKGTEHYLDILVKRDDVKLAVQHPKIGDFEGEVGIEATEKSQSLRSGHLSPNANVSKRALYVFEEADYDRWLVQMGARYDWHDVNAPLDSNEHFIESGIFNASNHTRQFEVASGSLGATYRVTPNWSVAGNIARGFRAPSIFELYAGGEHGGVQAYQLGNPDLKAETALNTDLSLRWQTPKTQMVATVYQNWIDNYIYLANTGLYRYTEAAIEEGLGAEGQTETSSGDGLVPEMQSRQTNAQIHGFELSVNRQLNQAWSTDAALELIAGRDTKNSQNLPLMPANNLRLGVHYQPQDWAGVRAQKVSLGVKMVDSQKTAGDYEPFSQFDTTSFGRASTDAYALWNVGYQAQVKLDRQVVSLGARVENLFDTDYVDFLSTYKGYTLNQGRNVQLSARMSF
ncbi:TonB-dependent receptor [Thiomicrorhabdus aquaedulcis]|uniref:TonB-dependent receptor n=1 Tax=Thiomicrorhabdus aquaedulcis TaxID=2211106 RepID=UPI000FD75E74|nr:TonB-dependent receptor [Thiomicrorhabdus aquaedulcis]